MAKRQTARPERPIYAERREHWNIVGQYDSSYWSGLQTQIYLGNLVLDEFVQITYQVFERTQPYYGYASHVANRIHHGTRLIAGEISVNFQNFGYLFGILEKLRQTGGDHHVPKAEKEYKYKQPPPPDDSTRKSFIISSLDDLKDVDLTGDFFTSLKESFQTPFERAGQETLDLVPVSIPSNRGLYEGSMAGIDITILMGGSLSPGQTLKVDGAGNLYTEPTAQVVPGDESLVFSKTGLVLEGCSISTQAMTIADDGRPIMQTLSFTGRNIRPVTG